MKIKDSNLRLKEVRKETGLTQDSFAKSLEEKLSRIRDLENEKQKTIPTELALKIEKLYNVNFRWLLTGEGEKYLKEVNPTELERLQEENEELTQEIGFMEVATRLLELEKKVEKLEKSRK